MTRLLIRLSIVFACFVLSRLALATGPTTAPVSEVRQQVRGQDGIVRKGGFDAIVKYYHATNDEEHAAARTLARFQVAAVHLQDAAESKFDKDAGDAVVNAIGGRSNTDLDQADIEVHGDRARIVWKGDVPPNALIKVDGLWKVDVADFLKMMIAAGESMKSIDTLVPLVQGFADEVKAGRYKSLKQLNEAIDAKLKDLP